MTLTTPFVPRALEGFALSRMTVGLAVRGHRGRRRAQPVHQPQPAVRRRAPGAASPRRLLLLLLLADGRAAHARCLAAWQVRSSQQLEELAKAALLAVMRAHAYPRVHHPCGGGHPDGGAGRDPSRYYRGRLFQPPEQSGRARGHASRLTLSGLCAARGFRNTSRSTTKASLDRSSNSALPYRTAMQKPCFFSTYMASMRLACSESRVAREANLL